MLCGQLKLFFWAGMALTRCRNCQTIFSDQEIIQCRLLMSWWLLCASDRIGSLRKFNGDSTSSSHQQCRLTNPGDLFQKPTPAIEAEISRYCWKFACNPIQDDWSKLLQRCIKGLQYIVYRSNLAKSPYEHTTRQSHFLLQWHEDAQIGTTTCSLQLLNC